MKSTSSKSKSGKKWHLTWQRFRWFSAGFLLLVISVVVWTASKSRISDFDLILSGCLVVLALPVTLFNRKLEKQFKAKNVTKQASTK